MTLLPEDLTKILFAIAAGGLIGIEREYRDKSAGFRTLIFICIGSTLFTILSSRLAPNSDPNRIAANIVTGIGFLGAGVILREGGRVMGLTTAAMIWLTASIGMGIGGGQYLFTGIVVALILVILVIFPRLEHWIDNINEERTYEIVSSYSTGQLDDLECIFKDCGLKVRSHKFIKSPGGTIITWTAFGSPKSHEDLLHRLYDDPAIQEFRY